MKKEEAKKELKPQRELTPEQKQELEARLKELVQEGKSFEAVHLLASVYTSLEWEIDTEQCVVLNDAVIRIQCYEDAETKGKLSFHVNVIAGTYDKYDISVDMAQDEDEDDKDAEYDEDYE